MRYKKVHMHEFDPEELIWKQQFRDLVRSGQALYEAVKIGEQPAENRVEKTFSCRVPESFLRRMASGDPLDPLFLQVAPQNKEIKGCKGFIDNPLQEKPYEGLPILKKYHGRALWLISDVCAVHCRYCFRRETKFSPIEQDTQGWQDVFEALQAMPDLREVILSGGDPLVLPTALIQKSFELLQRLKNLQAIRIHTRLPIVLPARITKAFCAVMARSKIPTVLVVHCNHPNELTVEVKEAIARLKAANVTVLNQSVLLHRVNDDAKILAQLSEKLFSYGILPYYLHYLDPVKGAAHFHVPLEKARRVVQDLLAQVSGYLVPRFVQEVPGCESKVPIDLYLTEIA